MIIVTVALLLAEAVQNSPELQESIAGLDYFGVTLLAIVAGLNVFIPLPAGTFAPIFVEAGLWMPFIIVALTLGTIIADYIGYVFGRWGRVGISEKYPKLMAYYENLITRHHFWLLPAVFIYASFSPLPNDAIILPLAILGMRFRTILIPLTLGNLLYHTMFSYGAQNLFLWWF